MWIIWLYTYLFSSAVYTCLFPPPWEEEDDTNTTLFLFFSSSNNSYGGKGIWSPVSIISISCTRASQCILISSTLLLGTITEILAKKSSAELWSSSAKAISNFLFSSQLQWTCFSPPSCFRVCENDKHGDADCCTFDELGFSIGGEMNKWIEKREKDVICWIVGYGEIRICSHIVYCSWPLINDSWVDSFIEINLITIWFGLMYIFINAECLQWYYIKILIKFRHVGLSK